MPFDSIAAEVYGRIRAQLEVLGTPIGPNDQHNCSDRDRQECSKAFDTSAVPIVQMLLFPSLWEWFVRIAVFLLCMLAIAIIFESLG